MPYSLPWKEVEEGGQEMSFLVLQRTTRMAAGLGDTLTHFPSMSFWRGQWWRYLYSGHWTNLAGPLVLGSKGSAVTRPGLISVGFCPQKGCLPSPDACEACLFPCALNLAACVSQLQTPPWRCFVLFCFYCLFYYSCPNFFFPFCPPLPSPCLLPTLHCLCLWVIRTCSLTWPMPWQDSELLYLSGARSISCCRWNVMAVMGVRAPTGL